MKKILIAGAGHGGLSAALNLAREHFDVTVFEAKARDEIGWDWHDYMQLTTFDFTGFSRPPQTSYGPGLSTGYYNPKKTVLVCTPAPGELSISIDRKQLYAHLINECEAAGVRFAFGVSVVGPLSENGRILGLKLSENGVVREERGDLVIDAAGFESPVRSNLPHKCGIHNVISPDDIFTIYRAYFENTTGEISEPPFRVYFFHCGKPGMDWSITEPGYVDLLIGKFGGRLYDSEIGEALADFRADYPFVGDKIERGGVIGQIPLKAPLSKLLCDGYAAVGDVAYMTDPMSGSGIDYSLRAGKLLADAIIAAGDAGYTEETLWAYHYNFFQMHGNKLVFPAKLRRVMSRLNAADVDYLMEKGVLGEAELAGGTGNMNTSTLAAKFRSLIPKLPTLLPQLAPALSGFTRIDKVAAMLPQTYDPDAVKAWRDAYDAL